ncbi:MAG: aldo/keto reductase, partial [Terriglobia bacterium]
MNRRDFIARAALGLGAACAGGASVLAAPSSFDASDTVTIGKTGIRTSRLACGTGTVGFAGHSHQTRLGVNGLAD